MLEPTMPDCVCRSCPVSPHPPGRTRFQPPTRSGSDDASGQVVSDAPPSSPSLPRVSSLDATTVGFLSTRGSPSLFFSQLKSGFSSKKGLAGVGANKNRISLACGAASGRPMRTVAPCSTPCTSPPLPSPPRPVSRPLSSGDGPCERRSLCRTALKPFLIDRPRDPAVLARALVALLCIHQHTPTHTHQRRRECGSRA